MDTETNVTSPRELMVLFEKFGLQPHKRLGQNFLIDANIARKIVNALELDKGELVIEIGPGAGALTLLLARSGVELLALEIDRGLTRLLGDLLKSRPSVSIVNQDVLKVNWGSLVGSYLEKGRSVKLVSNLPYVISGPFIYSLLKEGFPFKSAVIMLQKEVARRLVAVPGKSDYGGLSVLCSYYAYGEILFNVSRNVFWPRPGVDSAVIRLTPRKRLLSDGEEKVLWYLVQGVFQQRRKTMHKNMGRLYPELKSYLPEIFLKASLDGKARPEELSPDQFALLTRITYNYHK